MWNKPVLYFHIIAIVCGLLLGMLFHKYSETLPENDLELLPIRKERKSESIIPDPVRESVLVGSGNASAQRGVIKAQLLYLANAQSYAKLAKSGGGNYGFARAAMIARKAEYFGREAAASGFSDATELLIALYATDFFGSDRRPEAYKIALALFDSASSAENEKKIRFVESLLTPSQTRIAIEEYSKCRSRNIKSLLTSPFDVSGVAG